MLDIMSSTPYITVVQNLRRKRQKIIMKNILHVLRAERRLSQEDLAKMLNVSRQTINAIEREKYDPSLPLALKIAKLFDKKVEDIFFPEGTK